MLILLVSFVCSEPLKERVHEKVIASTTSTTPAEKIIDILRENPSIKKSTSNHPRLLFHLLMSSILFLVCLEPPKKGVHEYMKSASTPLASHQAEKHRPSLGEPQHYRHPAHARRTTWWRAGNISQASPHPEISTAGFQERFCCWLVWNIFLGLQRKHPWNPGVSSYSPSFPRVFRGLLLQKERHLTRAIASIKVIYMGQSHVNKKGLFS